MTYHVELTVVTETTVPMSADYLARMVRRRVGSGRVTVESVTVSTPAETVSVVGQGAARLLGNRWGVRSR